ncbi:MAG: hypothetical protein U1E45_11940 [Geminicoccaceae bacterium]
MAVTIRCAGLLAVSVFLAACQGSDGPSNEVSLLEAAGFKRMSPASASQQESLGQLPPGQIVAVPRLGSVRYVMADPEGCGCIYVGDAQQFEGFQRLTRGQAIAVGFDQQSAARWSTVYGAAWGDDW